MGTIPTGTLHFHRGKMYQSRGHARVSPFVDRNELADLLAPGLESKLPYRLCA